MPIIYLLFFKTPSEDTDSEFVWRWPFTSKTIPDDKLKDAFPKFPTTILNLRSVRGVIVREGYKLSDSLIDALIIENICSAIPREEGGKTNGSLPGNCLDSKLISQDVGNIENANLKTKQKWAQTLYRFEYETGHRGFTLDGVLDKEEIGILAGKILKTVDKEFREKTKVAFISLVRDIQKEDSLLPEGFIYNALQSILKANSAQEGVIIGEWERGKRRRERRNTISEWIEGIYRFQTKNKLSPPKVSYGVIRDPDDPTYKVLKQTVIGDLQVPRSTLLSARNQFETTKRGIAQITRSVYNKLLSDTKLEKSLENRYMGVLKARSEGSNELNFQLEEDIKTKLPPLLGVRDNSLAVDFEPTIYESTALKQDQWISAIYRYQKYSLGMKNPTGILSGNDEASQRIIQVISKQLKDELQYY